MVKQLRILPEAQQDAADAYDWYEERRRGLGEEFLHCVDAFTPSVEIPKCTGSRMKAIAGL